MSVNVPWLTPSFYEHEQDRARYLQTDRDLAVAALRPRSFRRWFSFGRPVASRGATIIAARGEPFDGLPFRISDNESVRVA